MPKRRGFLHRAWRWITRKRSYECGYVDGWNAAEKWAFDDGWEQAKRMYEEKGE